MATFTYNAVYQISDTFELDFDLNKVFSWEIKWGVMYVVMNEGDEEIEINPTYCNTDQPQFKHPNNVLDDDYEDILNT